MTTRPCGVSFFSEAFFEIHTGIAGVDAVSRSDSAERLRIGKRITVFGRSLRKPLRSFRRRRFRRHGEKQIEARLPEGCSTSAAVRIRCNGHKAQPAEEYNRVSSRRNVENVSCRPWKCLYGLCLAFCLSATSGQGRRGVARTIRMSDQSFPYLALTEE